MRGAGRRRRSPLPRRRRRWVGGSWCAADRSPCRQYRLPGHATPPHHPDSRPGHAGGVCGIASTGSGSRHRHGGPGPGRGPRGLGQVVRLLPRSRRCGRQWSVDACHRGTLPGPRRPGRRDRRRSWGDASVRWPLLGFRDPCRRPIHPRGALTGLTPGSGVCVDSPGGAGLASAKQLDGLNLSTTHAGAPYWEREARDENGAAGSTGGTPSNPSSRPRDCHVAHHGCRPVRWWRSSSSSSSIRRWCSCARSGRSCW